MKMIQFPYATTENAACLNDVFLFYRRQLTLLTVDLCDLLVQ